MTQTKSARDSIESANAPLAYKAGDNIELIPQSKPTGSQLAYRVATRALAGMQKEALVAQSGSDTVWRMVCDEGPYLNGTDLAPPPLAFFSAGMASSIAANIQTLASERDIELSDLNIIQDNIYSMEGSAVRGTMIAGAMPVEMTISGSVSNSDASFAGLVFDAMAHSPVDALMREELVDTFSITHNGEKIAPDVVEESSSPIPHNPAGLFANHSYRSDDQEISDCVTKLESTDSVFDADHGTGAAMKETQKRQLQIRSILTIREDGIRQIKVQIFKPVGSVFQFLSDDSPALGGQGRAPSGLALVSAGIAFCYMTQLGRYAGIVKKNLDAYGVVQDTLFDPTEGKVFPVDTHTFIETSEDADITRKYIDMGEQTCFLHGACRMSNKTRIKIKA